MNEITKQWDQFPDEPAAAFRAFNCYKNLPANKRSVDAAWEVFAPDVKGAPVTRGFSRWRKKFLWEERVSAWEQHLASLSDKKVEKVITKDKMLERDERRKMLKVLKVNVYKFAMQLQESENKPNTGGLTTIQLRGLATVVQIYMEQSRREYNDMSPEDDEKPIGESLTGGSVEIRERLQQELAEAIKRGSTDGISQIVQ